MSRQYTKEFREEAVRQVTDRGYTVTDVASRLGVSAQSLYKWVKAESPTKDEELVAELQAIKRENLRLKAELRQAEEDRDILKKAAAYFAKEQR
jgi:transposase